MSPLLGHFIILTVLIISLDGEVQQDRPKIKTIDGDLVIEPGFDKNIYLRTNGPKSTVFVGGVNILSVNISDTGESTRESPQIDLDNYLNGPDGIIRRLERLESRRDIQPNDALINITLLWRRVNRLTNRLTNLQTLVNTLGRDECMSRPCMHGGTCLNLARGYHCLCPANWEGVNCDEDVNECVIYRGTDLGCQNGANCVNTPGSYECNCSSGWNGIHCTRKNKSCSEGNFEMCGHGTCIPTNAGEGIKCICDQGWTTDGIGPACLTDVNECDSSFGPRCSVNPKVDCINLPGSFRCGQCPAGYEGDGYACSDIDECLVSNGGCSTSPMVTCHNTIGSRICGSCPPGYEGDGITCTWRGSCRINRGGCHPSAQCIDNAAGGGQMAQCICPPGMEGDGIGINGCYVATGNFTRGCETNPCGVHGQCHPLPSGYTCICYRGYGGARCDVSRDYCLSNPCLNGGTCKVDESSPRGFRCECTAQYTGDLCHVAARSCGGLLQAEEGSIVYPLNNSSYYNHNARCAWVIQTERDKVVNVTFSKFNLEANPECLYDFLQIHDGRSSASQIIGRFCGNEFPKGGNIISSHNNLYLWFRSDQTVAKDGFALHWNSINPVCGGEIDATVHGHISSPGSPGKYPPNRDCYWHLTTKLGKRIQLHFFALDIEAHSNCSFDYLAIYDGELSTDPLISQYCNSSQPAPVTSSGSDLLIHFHSDAYNSGYGFQIAFAPAEGIPGCGGLYTSDKGEIKSPTYEGKYLSNMVCEYLIRVSSDTKIKLNFKSFKLENSLKCKMDFLKIYDGPNEGSRLVGRFCGTTYLKTYTSSSNQVYLKFKTDHSMSDEGFLITYQTVCQQTIFGDSGVIKSPGYPFNYPTNRMCEYLIGTAPGKAIQLSFQDFDIEDNSYRNCGYDSIEIRDGINVNATLLGKYCGTVEHTPPVLTSSKNFLYIKFRSDMTFSRRGFYANFTSVDLECGGIYREAATISHPDAGKETYSNDQTCEWVIIAPEGMHIKVNWMRFDLESMPSCGSDYVELTEVDKNNEKNSLGKYCGHTMPPTMTTTTNQLEIKFLSDSSVRSVGFSLNVMFLDERFHCGGTYTKVHGFIYSPGWPKRYQNNRECVWTITAPAGRQISLNITQFELERPINDRCDFGDYLEIRNGASQSSPLIQRLCGTFLSRRIVSMSNVLYLKFHSDYYLSGKGFKIEWFSTITGCGGTLSSSSGSISSPNYPLTYNENAECFYKIVTSAGSRIRITFQELELERTLNCRDDFIEIFDGRDENSASLGRLCYLTNEFKTLESSTNYLFIKFRSDFYIGGKGFLLDYTTICQNNVTGLHGIIESPGYPGNYPLNLNCSWIINVPNGNKINVTFTDFEIAVTRKRISTLDSSNGRIYWMPRETCDNDFLRMKDSADINFGQKICGSNLAGRLRRFSTMGNALQIEFVTKGLFPRHGFRLEWARFGCGGYIQKSFGSLHIDPSETSHGDLECEWIIETPEDSSVTFTVTNLYMTDTVNCTSDAIEIYNGKTKDYPLLTKICHRTGGLTSVTSTSNFMLVRFIKQSSLKDVFFMANFVSYAFGCGGRIETMRGIIHSKNYPKNYENDMNCLWTIAVPKNYRIELNFEDFDLYSTDEKDQDCGDNISVYDGQYVLYSNYTVRLCPNTQPSRIISKNNLLGVRFLSDGSGVAKGFKANFTITCGSIITARYDGILMHDRWHKNYLRDNCTWTIKAPSLDQKVSVTIRHMSIPKNNSMLTNRRCPQSFLRIYDGEDSDAPVVDEFCGRKVPPTIVSHGSAITIVFGAYNGTALGEFTIHYSSLMSSCGGSLSSEEGSIASPNYPQSYPPGASCEWILSTSSGNRVYIAFEEFDLEWSENCNEDYVEVRENNGAGKLLGVYCGNTIPANTTIAAKLYIKFHSGKENTRRGFIMHYGFLHGNEISGERGEISSPMYPHTYDGAGEYTWRVSTNPGKEISLNVLRLEIAALGTSCYNNLVIYDGYDESAPLLEKLCGLLIGKQIRSTSNVVFIKLTLDESNTGSLFYIHWANSDSYVDTDDDQKPNCGSNGTIVISPGEVFNFSSPKYPNVYDENLNCEWVFKTQPGRTLNLHFKRIDLEELPMCFADYISVYGSNTALSWNPVKEHICLAEHVKDDFNASSYMKVVMISDASIGRDGFEAEVTSLCGGLVNERSGVIQPTIQDLYGKYMLKCSWKIKVRPGRVIKLNFEHFNITNRENQCSSFVAIRNGDSIEAPMLSTGKYCGYENEIKTNIESTSNSIFVTYNSGYVRDDKSFLSFKLRYEEKGIECGAVSKLDSDHTWEVLNSPNYPAVPTPYSECVWIFTGPPGEILKIDFIERFDLDHNINCDSEYVEIRDGTTELSPIKGKYCREKPSTVKTSNNAMYIKYYTQLAEPRNGFKANVSIEVCGGTIRASKGEVLSPGYPRLLAIPYGTVCEWRIIGSLRQMFLIKPQEIELPESQSPCDTKVTIEETEAVNNTVTVLQTYCGDEINNMDPVETSSNEVVIKLRIGQPAQWSSSSTVKGFRFTFNSSHPMCGGEITTPEGFLFTPGYPGETTQRYCQWRITVPDKTRRVRLEILDSNTEKHKIGMFNDLNFQTAIQILPTSDSEISDSTVFESSGNTLAIYLWLNTLSSKHRFKARFSSNDPALCGGSLTGSSGELESPILDRSYTCEWKYRSDLTGNENLTLLITAKVNSSGVQTRCRFSDPKIIITNGAPLYSQKTICGNTDISYTIPCTEFDLKAIQMKGLHLGFHIKWKLQPCGGKFIVGLNPVNMLTVPENYNDTLDCAWYVISPSPGRVNLKLEGTFSLNCDEEFIKIRDGNELSSDIGYYCKDKMQDTVLNVPFNYMTVEYHSNAKNSTNIRLIVSTVTDQCGGMITTYQSTFESPNYPKLYKPNMECAWEIQATLGNRISLRFIDRFMIEEKNNCTKDAVIIYDWRDNAYVHVGKVCGRIPPPVFNSTYNRMKVVLRTDATVEADGFRAQWLSICGGQLNATAKEQILYSPGFPERYQPDLSCVYDILGGNSKVLVKFLSFELEGTYPTCEYDNLTITAISDNDYLLATYCGNEMPSPIHAYNKVTLTFKSDRYIQRKGFHISYQLYQCGGQIKEPTVISSNLMTDSYDHNENCTWNIEAPVDKVVVVKFEYIELESDSECLRDYVSVFDSNSVDENTRLAQICGNVTSSTVLRSTGNKMLVQFVSDYSISYKGFKANVYFSYSTTVGCGGQVDLTQLASGATHLLKSPLLGSSVVYENYLDCQWNILAPPDFTVKIKFNNFHIAPCAGVNQTALGFSKCDCDYVEIVDGWNPDDMVVGTFCGHNVPQELISSRELMSLRLHTDGEEVSAGFTAELSLKPNICGQTTYRITETGRQTIRSPGYPSVIPRNLHCVYHIFPKESMSELHLKIKIIDLRPGVPQSNKCNVDKLLIQSVNEIKNMSVGKNYVLNQVDYNPFYYYEYESEMIPPKTFEYCGMKKDVDLYVASNIVINLLTSPETDNVAHTGIMIDIDYPGYCGRNYTESQGRIKVSDLNLTPAGTSDCYTLISAFENQTISIYFINHNDNYWNEGQLDIYDGKDTNAGKLATVHSSSDAIAFFSTGRYILLHNYAIEHTFYKYDLNYVTTDKGIGCGGKLDGPIGVVTSPLYPSVYRRQGSCEWELETSPNTKLRLRFKEFDLGRACDQNYVQLVDRSGKVISSYCSEPPADYTSEDNYVKIVFTTTMNNGGTGWLAQFMGIL